YRCSSSKTWRDFGPGTGVTIFGSFSCVVAISLRRARPGYVLAGTLQEPRRAPCDSARSMLTDTAIAGPVVKVDDFESAAGIDDRVAAPRIQPDGGCGGRSRTREGAMSRLRQFAALRQRAEIFSPAHSVKLHHRSFHCLLHVCLADAAMLKVYERGAQRFKTLDASYVVIAQRVQITALDVQRH